MRQFVLLSTLFALIVPMVASAQQPDQRRFTFDYKFTIQGHESGDKIRFWIPLPQSQSPYQSSRILAKELPGDGTETRETKYGNRMIYRELTATSDQPISASLRFEIERSQVKAFDPSALTPPVLPSTRQQFLLPTKTVPVEGIPLQWKKQGDDAVKTARGIYNKVDDHVRYDKSQPGYGNGDTLWVCNSRFGNCTDFHSLFISMARASGIPARFEIGFPIPADQTTGKVGGYHCWASFYTSKFNWVPVDISEADKHPEMKEYYFGNLTPHRVHFTTGRDINLVPQQASPALNYFVYPHVEINGKAASKEQLKLHFSFKDSPSK